jgi:chromosome partitioning protein
MGKTIFIGARKGGVGKTMTTASLGAGLAREGKKTLLIDTDSQNSLTVSLGFKEPDKLPITLTTVMNHIINETAFDPTDGLIRHSEGFDLLPANNSLTGIELALATLISRETVLRQYIEMIKPLYEFILIDTPPTLDLITVNALAAADSVIIPITPKYLDAKGLELLLKSIAQIKRQINPTLSIDGILLTMVDRRANHTWEVIELVESAYGGNIRIFGEHIPRSIRAAETAAKGVSIFTYEPNGRIAAAYSALTREVLGDAS